MLNNLKINESIRACGTPSKTNKRMQFTITRVGYDPDMLTLRNYAIIEECDAIIETCNNSNDTMKQVETISNENVSTPRKIFLVSSSPPNPEAPYC